MNIHVNESLTARLDEERGTLSRAAYIIRILESTLYNQPIREDYNERESTRDNRVS